MVQVVLKGVNTVRRQLADGTTKLYYYAWKGGPRLPDDPRSPEFAAAYHKAYAEAAAKPGDGKTLQSLLDAFQNSGEFKKRAERTRSDYVQQIKKIEKRFGTFPIAALPARETRDKFLTWRDEMAERSIRQADYAFTVLSAVLSWALDRGKIGVNPCAKVRKLYDGSRAEIVWTDDDEAKFLEKTSPEIQLAYLMAVWTGQRQGDLLRLTWTAYDGQFIRLKQSKTGMHIAIPAGQPLRDALDVTPRRATQILTNTRGRVWTEDGFRRSWRKAAEKAGIAGKTFNDLRGTAVTRLARAGCTQPQINIFTGHAMSDVRSILEKHYLHHDPEIALDAVRKLEKRTGAPKRAPKRSARPKAKSDD